MTIKNFLKLKAANIVGFTNVNDNPFYSTFQTSGGWNFQEFDSTKVIDEGYAKNADLYSIVRKISSSAATIPLKLYDIKSDGEKELIESGELYDLIQQPNRIQTFTEFLDESMIYLLLSGNNYITGFKSMGFGEVFRELNVLPSNFVTINSGGINEPIKSYVYQDNYNVEYEANDVMQVKYPNPKGSGSDRLYGLSPMEAGNMALQSSNNIYDAKGNIIKNTGVNGLISSNSERSYTKEQADEMQSKWDAKNGDPSKYGRNLVTSAQVNYTQLGLSPDKLQLLEGSLSDLRAMCRVYSVDSKLFGDTAASTYNNMQEAKKGMYTDAVLPNLDLWLKSFNNWFIADWSKHDNKNYCLEADTSSIEVLQSNQKEEADKDKVIADTIINVLNSQTSTETKVQTLMYSIGMNEEEARLIVGTETIEDVN